MGSRTSELDRRLDKDLPGASEKEGAARFTGSHREWEFAKAIESLACNGRLRVAVDLFMPPRLQFARLLEKELAD